MNIQSRDRYGFLNKPMQSSYSQGLNKPLQLSYSQGLGSNNMNSNQFNVPDRQRSLTQFAETFNSAYNAYNAKVGVGESEGRSRNMFVGSMDSSSLRDRSTGSLNMRNTMEMGSHSGMEMSPQFGMDQFNVTRDLSHSAYGSKPMEKLEGETDNAKAVLNQISFLTKQVTKLVKFNEMLQVKVNKVEIDEQNETAKDASKKVQQQKCWICQQEGHVRRNCPRAKLASKFPDETPQFNRTEKEFLPDKEQMEKEFDNRRYGPGQFPQSDQRTTTSPPRPREERRFNASPPRPREERRFNASPPPPGERRFNSSPPPDRRFVSNPPDRRFNASPPRTHDDRRFTSSPPRPPPHEEHRFTPSSFPHGERRFSPTPLHGERRFSPTPLHGERRFSPTPLHGQRRFSPTPLHGERRFSPTPLHGERRFSPTPLHGERRFSQTPLHGERRFSPTPLHGERRFSPSPVRPGTRRFSPSPLRRGGRRFSASPRRRAERRFSRSPPPFASQRFSPGPFPPNEPRPFSGPGESRYFGGGLPPGESQFPARNLPRGENEPDGDDPNVLKCWACGEEGHLKRDCKFRGRRSPQRHDFQRKQDGPSGRGPNQGEGQNRGDRQSLDRRAERESSDRRNDMNNSVRMSNNGMQPGRGREPRGDRGENRSTNRFVKGINCFLCGKEGHFKDNCPDRDRRVEQRLRDEAKLIDRERELLRSKRKQLERERSDGDFSGGPRHGVKRPFGSRGLDSDMPDRKRPSFSRLDDRRMDRGPRGRYRD